MTKMPSNGLDVDAAEVAKDELSFIKLFRNATLL
jgi:hypothetical protein